MSVRLRRLLRLGEAVLMARRHKDLPRPFAAVVDAAVGLVFRVSGVPTSRRSTPPT